MEYKSPVEMCSSIARGYIPVMAWTRRGYTYCVTFQYGQWVVRRIKWSSDGSRCLSDRLIYRGKDQIDAGQKAICLAWRE
jgi:hypothetical protein